MDDDGVGMGKGGERGVGGGDDGKRRRKGKALTDLMVGQKIYYLLRLIYPSKGT